METPATRARRNRARLARSCSCVVIARPLLVTFKGPPRLTRNRMARRSCFRSTSGVRLFPFPLIIEVVAVPWRRFLGAAAAAGCQQCCRVGAFRPVDDLEVRDRNGAPTFVVVAAGLQLNDRVLSGMLAA